MPRVGCPRVQLRALRRRRRHERIADDAQDLLARALRDDRYEAAQLEPRKLDTPLRAARQEAEVGEEVAREDRLVHLKAAESRAVVAVAIRKCLEGMGALVARV